MGKLSKQDNYAQRARELVERHLPSVLAVDMMSMAHDPLMIAIAQALADAVVQEREACELLLLHARNEHLRLKAVCLETPDAKPMAVMQQIRAEECDALAEALRQRGEGTP